MADYVTIRSPRGEEKQVSRNAVSSFPNWVVLTSDGRVNTRATTAAHGTDKKDGN